jgi:Chlorophyllase enzyme
MSPPRTTPTAGSAGSMPAAGGGGSSGMAGAAGAMAGAGGAPSGMAGMTGTGMQTLPAVTDYTKPGPFKTTTNANVGPGNNFTIFRPEPLGENGFKHSPIIFGPGILTTASLYNTLLTHLASHGFVTICVNSLSGGPNDPGNLSTMKEGLEWLIAQNGQAGMYQNKLAVDRAITMGYSIGATASTQLSSHPAIITTVSIHGHNTKGDPHGPIWLITGTMDVIDDNRTTLKTLEEAPAILTALPIGHLDVLTELSASGRYIAPITAWLRYWVNGDQAAKSYFWGDGCKICTSPWITPETNEKWKAQML